MSSSGPLNITLRDLPDNRVRGEWRLPGREDLRRSTLLKRGGKYKADLFQLDLGDGPMVIKDFAHRSWFIRQIGRLQIRREWGAYGWLSRLSGIPRLIGRVDEYALAFERVDGRTIGYSIYPERNGQALFDGLVAVVASLHERGLVHWDLRTRKNVIACSDRIVVLDFASAFWVRPGGLAHRLFFGWMKRVDHSALLKWKQILCAGPYTEDEAAFLRRFRFWRGWWIFSRKAKPDS